MRVIFLDIDGVLNNDRTVCRSPTGNVGVSGSLVNRLSKIVRETDAKIVLTSTWIFDYLSRTSDGKYLEKRLSYKGLKISDCISCDYRIKKHRGASIIEYLEQHPDISHYVIIDDNIFDLYFSPITKQHLVITDEREGITDRDVDECIRILNGELNVSLIPTGKPVGFRLRHLKGDNYDK